MTTGWPPSRVGRPRPHVCGPWVGQTTVGRPVEPFAEESSDSRSQVLTRHASRGLCLSGQVRG